MVGNLPNCEADRVLAENPLSPRLFRKAPVPKVEEVADDDEDLKVEIQALNFNFFKHCYWPCVDCLGIK